MVRNGHLALFRNFNEHGERLARPNCPSSEHLAQMAA
jgi:hypothetical protein